VQFGSSISLREGGVLDFSDTDTKNGSSKNSSIPRTLATDDPTIAAADATDADDGASSENTGISIGTVAGIVAPLLLVMGVIVWWLKCGPAAAVAQRTADLKTERDQREARRNTMEMHEMPDVGAPRTQRRAPPTSVADYEYGSATAAQAYTYVDPNERDSAATSAHYEYSDAGSVPDPTPTADGSATYSLYTGSMAVEHDDYDMPAADAVMDQTHLMQRTTDNTGVYSLYTGSTAVQHDDYDMPTANAVMDTSTLHPVAKPVPIQPELAYGFEDDESDVEI
jgi:hypothetical protein